MKTCKDYPEVNCCESCHEDIEMGFSGLLEIEEEEGKVIALVCCSIFNWINAHKPEHPHQTQQE